MSLTSGSRLGPYEVLSAIGQGGMGEMWRALASPNYPSGRSHRSAVRQHVVTTI